MLRGAVGMGLNWGVQGTQGGCAEALCGVS